MEPFDPLSLPRLSSNKQSTLVQITEQTILNTHLNSKTCVVGNTVSKQLSKWNRADDGQERFAGDVSIKTITKPDDTRMLCMLKRRNFVVLRDKRFVMVCRERWGWVDRKNRRRYRCEGSIWNRSPYTSGTSQYKTLEGGWLSAWKSTNSKRNTGRHKVVKHTASALKPPEAFLRK